MKFLKITIVALCLFISDIASNPAHTHGSDEKASVPDNFKKLKINTQAENNNGGGIFLLTPSHNENFKRHTIPASIDGRSYTWNVDDSVLIETDRQLKNHLVQIWNVLSAPQETDVKETSARDRAETIVNTLNSLGRLLKTRLILTYEKKSRCLTKSLSTVLSAITSETCSKAQNLYLARMKLVDISMWKLISELEDYRKKLAKDPSAAYAPEKDIKLTRKGFIDVWEHFDLDPPPSKNLNHSPKRRLLPKDRDQEDDSTSDKKRRKKKQRTVKNQEASFTKR